MAEAGPASFLVVDELFAMGNPQFLPALRSYFEPTPFAAFAERWLNDSRPWAREQLLAYIDLPLNVPNHNALVKRLFKGSERRRDDLLMAAWAVAFDRLVRRVRKKGTTWNYQLRQSVSYERLVTPRDRVIYTPPRWGINPFTKQRTLFSAPPSGERLFSYHTRYYLRRRAWRYFRYMGYGRPDDYVAAAAAMITRYTNADLASGDNLMDCWSLLHACFAESEALNFTTHRARLKGGASVANLAAAPAFPDLWQKPSAAESLLSLVASARSTFARIWAIDLLRRWHAGRLTGQPVDRVIPLLSHPDDRVQAFALELFESAAGLDRLPFDRWLQLLQIRSLTVLTAVTEAMRRHVDPSAVTLFDAVTLAKAEPAPVARLGLHYLQSRSFDTPPQRQAIVHLADARSAAVGQEIAAWALQHLGRREAYDVEQVIRFFDSMLPAVRLAAREWLVSGSAGWDSPVLWSRLIESPFEDIRLFLVDSLQKRQAIPGVGSDALTLLWTGVLLNIHRGGRKKLTALRQISSAVRRDPSRAAVLMPVLAIAIRSVRVPETRAGLSAIVTAVAARPELAATVRQVFPELELVPSLDVPGNE